MKLVALELGYPVCEPKLLCCLDLDPDPVLIILRIGRGRGLFDCHERAEDKDGEVRSRASVVLAVIKLIPLRVCLS